MRLAARGAGGGGPRGRPGPRADTPAPTVVTFADPVTAVNVAARRR